MLDIEASGPGIVEAYMACVRAVRARACREGEFLFTAAHVGLPVVPTQPLNMDLCLRTGGTGLALIRRDECVCLESASKEDSRPPPLPLPFQGQHLLPPSQSRPALTAGPGVPSI